MVLVHGVHFGENIDQFHSFVFILEHRLSIEATYIQEERDIEEIEREKSIEERRAAMDDGEDLLASASTT
jgi:hypothetical protein